MTRDCRAHAPPRPTPYALPLVLPGPGPAIPSARCPVLSLGLSRSHQVPPPRWAASISTPTVGREQASGLRSGAGWELRFPWVELELRWGKAIWGLGGGCPWAGWVHGTECPPTIGSPRLGRPGAGVCISRNTTGRPGPAPDCESGAGASRALRALGCQGSPRRGPPQL